MLLIIRFGTKVQLEFELFTVNLEISKEEPFTMFRTAKMVWFPFVKAQVSKGRAVPLS
jgi:hypothetical protein